MNSAGYFFEYMRALLGERFDAFVDAYEHKPRHKALRVNTLKASVERFTELVGEPLERNPLCDTSFYRDVKPSLDPLYHAGLYYMQEPSASAAVAAFAPFIGERVLDLCAAPGGKATQAAQAMNGDGILFCNDPEHKRVKALVENIERLGIVNAVVTCNTASDYRRAGFDGYFDTLIVDAPCSGGGMMRYENVPYSADIVAGCAARQREILRDGVQLLAHGGHMLYSTCTFAKEENEDNVGFLRSLGMETVDIPLLPSTERGIGEKDARRVYPMNFDGEGHFYCVLVKTARGAECGKPPMRKKRGKVVVNKLALDTVVIFKRVLLPIEPPELDGLNVSRIGVPVFADGKDPSHALVHALSAEKLAQFGTVDISDRAGEYIRGAQLEQDAPNGFAAATVGGFALGVVKSAPTGNGVNALKNKYPKNLRV